MHASGRTRLRRQDADPPQPDRTLQQGVLAFGRGGRTGAHDDRRLRPAREQDERRGVDRRPHGRASACRDGPAHGRDRGCDCRATVKAFVIFALALAVFGAQPALDEDRDLAPTGTLRAVYLASNPAQAVQDRATGAIRGVSADLARELARRIGMPIEIKPVADPKAVIDAVSGAAADIGFVAFEPSRAGTVEFSQTYMLVRQSFLVLKESSIRAVADIDRTGQKIAGTHNDSITLFMKRKLRQATL